MDIYVIMTEGYTDCALAEAILQRYMGYSQYRNKKDMPEKLQKQVGVYPGQMGELEPKDMPHFYCNGEKAVMVKVAKGFSEIAEKLVLILDAMLSAQEDDSEVKGVFIICDADLPSEGDNRKKIENDLEKTAGVTIESKDRMLIYEELKLCYEIHLIPQSGAGAVERLLLQILEHTRPELAGCARNYREAIMEDAFVKLRERWAKGAQKQELYADKVQLGAALAVLKPDRPIGYAVKDCMLEKKSREELMKIEEFKALYQRLERWLGR